MAANQAESQLRISWHDSAWIPILSGENVLDYFCQRTNPFYDRTCNNENVKMQRLDSAQLQFMVGIEYELIHVQDPILYVIRKHYRHSADQVTFLANYYILAGIVYQSPDLGSVLNSRLLSTVHNLELAFDEALSYSKYTPSKGYWWNFKDQTNETGSTKKKTKKTAEPSSLFQRFRVDQLLGDFVNKFPPKILQQQADNQGEENNSVKLENQTVQVKEEPKTTDILPIPITQRTPTTTVNAATALAKTLPGRSASPLIGETWSTGSEMKPSTPPSKKRKIAIYPWETTECGENPRGSLYAIFFILSSNLNDKQQNDFHSARGRTPGRTRTQIRSRSESEPPYYFD
eukprot:gene20636-22671_t